jgi:arylsulfatase
MDRIANSGLRYNRVFSTALCSPTRAALITGRNHHSAGFGVISEQSTGFPGYNSIIAKDKATIGRILLDNGYSTSWFGKDHNTPAFAASQVGPFDQWPTGMGFEYFYGFVGGDADQWEPNLFRNTTQIYPFLGKEPGSWNLVTAMADDAIDWMTRIHQTDPSRPIFIKYAPGATHAPHHPTKEWVDKISKLKLFDEGWNKVRDRIFENQKRLGVIPKDTKLSPWPKDVLKEWDQLTADEKKLYIRQAEIFAAYAAYSDHEIGRVIQGFEDLGKLDNTLIIYINGDNGTSAEGGPIGTPNEVAFFNGVSVPRRCPTGEVLRRLGHRTNLQPYVGRLVVGFRRAVRLVQAERLAAWRDQPEHGGVVAGAHQGQGGPARAVHSRDRRGTHNPRSRRHPCTRSCRRHRPEADRGHKLRLHLRCGRRQNSDAAQHAVLRDDGPVGLV